MILQLSKVLTCNTGVKTSVKTGVNESSTQLRSVSAVDVLYSAVVNCSSTAVSTLTWTESSLEY